MEWRKGCIHCFVNNILKIMNRILKFKQFIQEQNNTTRPHAIILSGAPGSGKSVIARPLVGGLGFQEIDPDHAFEFLMRKHGLDMRMPLHEDEVRNKLRERANAITDRKIQNATKRGRNIILNKTAKDSAHTQETKNNLERSGYNTHMIMVHTDDDVSRQRNIRRGDEGGRTVPEHIRQHIWNAVNGLRGEYKKMFGENYHEIHNSIDHKTATEEERNQLNDTMRSLMTHFENQVGSKKMTEETKKYSHYDPEEWHKASHEDEYYDVNF